MTFKERTSEEEFLHFMAEPQDAETQAAIVEG